MKIAILVILSLFPCFAGAQDRVNDTLFFSYDSNYITTFKKIPNHYYIEDGHDINIGSFYFTGIQQKKTFDTKSKEINLKEYIRSSKFYDENRRLKLRDYELADYLEDYVIFLVKTENGKKSYIEVEASFEVE
jgi:hypothetical protein